MLNEVCCLMTSKGYHVTFKNHEGLLSNESCPENFFDVCSITNET